MRCIALKYWPAVLTGTVRLLASVAIIVLSCGRADFFASMATNIPTSPLEPGGHSMRGKIALEEHFAVSEPDKDAARRLQGNASWAETAKRLVDFHDLRLKDMDAYGIEYAILSLNAPAVQMILDTKEAITAARRSNDFLAEQVARRPDRFGGFAALPMQDPDAAAAELTRCIRELGFRGALVNGFTQRKVSDSVVFYDIPEYRPFWAQVAALDVPFYMHPRTAIYEHAHHYEGHPWLFSSAWGFAVETSIHVLRLIGSALFDEYPTLQIVIGHLGERIPFDMWRIDHRIEVVPTGYPAKKPVSAYMRSNVHITTSGNFHDSTLRCAIAEMGIERTLFAIDYPMERMASGADWFDQTPVLSEEERIRVGRTNAMKLFKLNLSP
jgi:predicted TIM-barrel fold metal-dependent hydrolase